MMTPLLNVTNVSKRFPIRGTEQFIHAVDDVSFSIAADECVGLVGESGCGKSTLVKLLCRLADPTEGRLAFNGADIGKIPAAQFATVPERREIQMVFQDPTDSLNPRFTAFDIIADPLRRLLRLKKNDALRLRVHELADLVGFPHELLGRFPHQLSGGQQQRLGIARAIAPNPKLLILDEPTSALDVSVQAVILHLLADLRAKFGIAYLFVSHDLNLVRLMSDRLLVMYLGKIVETGDSETIFRAPRHPYTRALLSAIPMMEPNAQRQRIRLVGEPRSPVDPPPEMCRFYGRCPDGYERCAAEMPQLQSLSPAHEAACHLVEEQAGVQPIERRRGAI